MAVAVSHQNASTQWENLQAITRTYLYSCDGSSWIKSSCHTLEGSSIKKSDFANYVKVSLDYVLCRYDSNCTPYKQQMEKVFNNIICSNLLQAIILSSLQWVKSHTLVQKDDGNWDGSMGWPLGSYHHTVWEENFLFLNCFSLFCLNFPVLFFRALDWVKLSKSSASLKAKMAWFSCLNLCKAAIFAILVANWFSLPGI